MNECRKEPLDRLLEAAAQYHERGLKVVPLTDGKIPKGIAEWQKKTFDYDAIENHLAGASDPGIGIQMGPCGEHPIIDFEWDSPEQRTRFCQLFGGEENVPIGPAFTSKHGEHRLFAFEPWMHELAKANFHVACLDIDGNPISKKQCAPLIIRIGTGPKPGSQSAFPPSRDKAWVKGRAISECELPRVTELAKSNMLATIKTRKSKAPASVIKPHSSGVDDAALADMLNIGPPEHENDGTSRLFALACRLVEHDLSDASGIATLRAYEQHHPFPRGYSDNDILQRIRDAEKRDDVQRGSVIRRKTDLGNAERFRDQHRADVRYCHVWGKWLVWDGRRWQIDDSGEVMRRAKRTARSIYIEASRAATKEQSESLAKWAVSTECNKLLGAMVTLAKSELPIAVEALDAQPWLLNCEDGTVDLRTGELRAHRREDYLTKVCPVKWSTDVPKLWLKFLNRIFADNQTLISFVQRLIGVSLVGDVQEHILPIFYGSGANGKSVLVITWLGILGEYGMKAPDGFLMASKTKQHPTELASLFGKRLVAISETDDGGRLSEALVKDLTGGEPIRARRMREDFWEFAPSHTPVLSTNHKPIIRGVDNGIWRRILLVPFAVTIPEAEQDKELASKLREEWPAILNWAVKGCIDWQQSGLQPPQDVLVATSGYRADMDTFGKFIDECCKLGPEYESPACELYTRYKSWAQDRGEHVQTQTWFGSRLSDRGFENARITRGAHKGRSAWSGIGLAG